MFQVPPESPPAHEVARQNTRKSCGGARVRGVAEEVVGASRAESLFKEERFSGGGSSRRGGEDDSCFDMVCCSF